MLEQLKTLMSPQARGAQEFVYSLTPEIRSAILLDLRYVLRDTARARQLPLLLMLVQTVERNNTRIRFPADVLARLAREIDGLRDKLPAKSPLLDLVEGVRKALGAAALAEPGRTNPRSHAGPHTITDPLPPPAGALPGAPAGPGPNTLISTGPITQQHGGPGTGHGTGQGTSLGTGHGISGPNTSGGTPSATAAALAAANAQAAARAAAKASAKAGPSTVTSGAPGAPAMGAADSKPAEAAPRLSAVEQAQQLKSAAAKVEVSYVTTVELGDNALAGYLTYCLSLSDYDKIIETLIPRVELHPRVWAWNLLVTTLRLARHPDFSDYAERFHNWLLATHPEAAALPGEDDKRRFSMERIAELERQELGENPPG